MEEQAEIWQVNERAVGVIAKGREEGGAVRTE